jgi:hypothetical protein
MAGMEALGRVCNVIPIASGVAFKMRNASVAMVVCTGTDTFTVTQASSFGGSYTAYAIIKNIYWATATNGTAAWNKLTYNPNNLVAPFGSGPLSAFTTGTTTGLTTATCAVFHLFTSEFVDPNNYVKVTASAAGLVSVYPADLTVQRGPANLEILSA